MQLILRSAVVIFFLLVPENCRLSQEDPAEFCLAFYPSLRVAEVAHDSKPYDRTGGLDFCDAG